MELLFSLPDWDFVGGSTQKRIFTMTNESGVTYDYLDLPRPLLSSST